MLSPTRLAAFTLIGAAFIASSPVAAEATVAQQIRRVENDLLPSVALKENLGRPKSIPQRMQGLGIPGISIAVIDSGKVAWTRAYGLSDTVEKTAVTPQTLFQAGSISKPIAALGAWKTRRLLEEDSRNAV